MEGKDCPRPLGQKEYNDLGKTVSLMLRICRNLFGSGKDVFLDSVICVAKGITDLEAKGIYSSDMFKKWSYWPKGFSGDLIDTRFEDNEVGDVGMIDLRTENITLLKIFCMKDLDYVMKIMVSWMTLDELEEARTKKYISYTAVGRRT